MRSTAPNLLVVSVWCTWFSLLFRVNPSTYPSPVACDDSRNCRRTLLHHGPCGLHPFHRNSSATRATAWGIGERDGCVAPFTLVVGDESEHPEHCTERTSWWSQTCSAPQIYAFFTPNSESGIHTEWGTHLLDTVLTPTNAMPEARHDRRRRATDRGAIVVCEIEGAKCIMSCSTWIASRCPPAMFSPPSLFSKN